MLGIRDYNYAHFTRSVLREMEDESFPGPGPGEQAPDFEGLTLSGEEVDLREFKGKEKRNVLLVFGSATCPFTAAAISGLKALYEGLDPDYVQVIFVYVREAHPAEKIPAHRSTRAKMNAARLLVDEEDMEMPVLVDDLHGTIHRKYSRLPNPAFLIDKSGRVAFRSRWTKPDELRAAIKELLDLQKERAEDHVIVRGGQDSFAPFSYDR